MKTFIRVVREVQAWMDENGRHEDDAVQRDNLRIAVSSILQHEIEDYENCTDLNYPLF